MQSLGLASAFGSVFCQARVGGTLHCMLPNRGELNMAFCIGVLMARPRDADGISVLWCADAFQERTTLMEGHTSDDRIWVY